ncbi:MAG: Ribonuclease HIII [Chlamydiia bacterium]|nr:Ribonuclease HIII [Chlamydiia bacterium]
MTSQPTCFVATIDPAKKEKLRAYLDTNEFTITQPPHTLFSAKKKGLSVTLYQSFKLTVQGKNKDDFIHFFLEPEILEHFSYSHPTPTNESNPHTKPHTKPHIGVDESGKGDFFGPLCIAGVYADEEGIESLLKLKVSDSKKLSDAKILKLADKIPQVTTVKTIVIYPEKYNQIYQQSKNLNQLLGWAHATIIQELQAQTGATHALIDQFAGEHVVETKLKQMQVAIELDQQHRAESDPIVAAASILARAAFVRGMDKLSKMCGITLQKGASNKVIDIGIHLAHKHSIPFLEKVCKQHFTTYKKIVQAVQS